MIRLFNFFLQRKSLVYARALFLQLYWLLRARRLDSPVWDLWMRASSAWNEEPCETSLSHLARVAAGDTLVGDCAHMSDLYCLQSLRGQVIGPDLLHATIQIK